MSDATARPGLLHRFGFPAGRPAVWYGVAGLVNSLGTGLFYPFALLFFLNRLGLPLVRVGLGLSIAAAVALLGVSPMGRLIDLFGAKITLVTACVLRGLVYASFLLVHSYVSFVVLSVVEALCMRTTQTADSALVGEMAEEPERTSWFALSRATFNAGIGVGSLIAGLLLTTGIDFGWLAVVNSASFLVAAAVYARLRPSRAGRPAGGAPAAPAAGVWRDRFFLAVAAGNALLYLAMLALELALPVYLQKYLAAPEWTISLVFALNTALITFLQLPMSARTRRVPRLRLMAFGALGQAVLFVMLIPAAEAGRAGLIAILVIGVALFTAGEILVSVAGLVAITDHAPPARRGSYLAANQLLLGVTGAIAPLLFTGLLRLSPRSLWAGLAVAVCLVALALSRMRPEVSDG